MKRGITHKDITMVLGILVALVIMFTLWVRTPAVETSRSLKLPKVPTAPSPSSIVKTSIEVLLHH